MGVRYLAMGMHQDTSNIWVLNDGFFLQLYHRGSSYGVNFILISNTHCTKFTKPVRSRGQKMEQERHLTNKYITQPVNEGLNEGRLHFVLMQQKVLLETNFPSDKRCRLSLENQIIPLFPDIP
jgi:hypothetical protein